MVLNFKKQLAGSSRFNSVKSFVLAVVAKAGEDNLPRLSSSLSFFGLLSVTPFIVLAVSAGALILGSRKETAAHLLLEAEKVGGPQVRDYLAQVIQSSQHGGTGLVASLLSLVVTFFSASNLFMNLDDSISYIWRIKQTGSFLRNFVVARILAFVSVLIFGLILLGWVGLDSAIGVLAREVPGFKGWQAVSYVCSILFFTIGFAYTLKALPRKRLTLRDTLPGALITAFLFSSSEFLLTFYFSRAFSVYTVAAGVVILLLWMYYSTMIYFLGVEITHVYSHKYGSLAGE